MNDELTEIQRIELRRLLVEQRERFVAQAAAMQHTFEELVAAADLEPPDDEHDPDGTTAYERAQVTSLRSVSEQGIAAIDLALEQVEAQAYGSCRGCGEPIAFERLVAVLGTQRCLACASGRT